MKYLPLVFVFILIIACKQVQTEGAGEVAHSWDTINVIDSMARAVAVPYDDSLNAVVVDTNTLKGKQHNLLKKFVFENHRYVDYTKAFDFNYDHYNDFIIGYYGMAGTGFKNRIEAYSYNPRKKIYVYDSLISDLANPSFFIADKVITSFYLAAGTGTGQKLEWINRRWQVTMEFVAENKGDTTVWEINYPLTGKKKNINRPYEYVPPQDILRHNWVDF